MTLGQNRGFLTRTSGLKVKVSPLTHSQCLIYTSACSQFPAAAVKQDVVKPAARPRLFVTVHSSGLKAVSSLESGAGRLFCNAFV